MRTETVSKTIYIAKDGREFLSADECKKYEELYIKMRYFKIYYEYDLTEGRGFSRHVYVAVCPSRFDNPFTIAERYAIDVLCEGHYASVGCQGYGLQKYYELIESDKEDYDKAKDRQVLISQRPIEGFPEPFDYYKEWNLR